MNILSPDWTPSPVAMQRAGAALLWFGLGTGLLLLLAVAWSAPELLPFLPLLLLGSVGLLYLLRHPFEHLCLTLLASVLILRHQPGIQTAEVLYGLYCIFFLATWFIDAVLRQRIRLFASRESKALLLFLLLVIALLPLSFFLGGTPRTIGRELIALVMVGFFFPIREACARHRHGVKVLLLVAVVLSIYVVFRNLLLYQAALHNSDQLIGVIQGRVIANDHIMTASSLFAFVFLLHALSIRRAAMYLIVFLLCFTGLLLTLSRGFWLAFALGLLFLFVVVERRHRVNIVLYGSTAALPLLAVGLFFFGDYVLLFLGGLLDRLVSIKGSLTKDLSMLGRIYESRGAIARIAENPLLGHGVGVPFSFHSILTRTTVSQTFMHNGYLSLWYRFGLVGTGLVLYWWGRSLWCGLRCYRITEAPLALRLAGLGAAASLVAFTLSAMTSNPFYHKDYLFGLAYIMGLACGTYARINDPRPSDAPA